MPHKTLAARREYGRRWRAANPGYNASKSAKRRKLYPEEKREEYQKHRAAYIARSKAWQAANPEKAKASKRKAQKKAYAIDPKRMIARSTAWKKRNVEAQKKYAEAYKLRKRVLRNAWRGLNPEKVKAEKRRRTISGKTAEQDHRRRARLRNATTENCSEAVRLLREKRACHWCSCPLTPGNIHIDHLIPLSRGGPHCPSNLVASCRYCNTSKGSKLPSEWLQEAA